MLLIVKVEKERSTVYVVRIVVWRAKFQCNSHHDGNNDLPSYQLFCEPNRPFHPKGQRWQRVEIRDTLAWGIKCVFVRPFFWGVFFFPFVHSTEERERERAYVQHRVVNEVQRCCL